MTALRAIHGEMTVREFWEWRVARTPDSPFLVTDEKTWTYGEFDRWVNQLAHSLRAADIRAGTHVALLLPSGTALLRTQWALQKLGAVWVPLIPSSTSHEISFILTHADADVLLTDAAGSAALADAGGPPSSARTLRVDALTGGPGGLSSGPDAGAQAPAPSGITPSDPMAIMYTSGSTGKPKGVVQPNVGFRTVAHAVADRLGIAEGDCSYCVMPLFHSGATHLVIGPVIAAGASVLVRPRFSRSAFWHDVRRHGATVSLLMPAMMSMLMTDAATPRDLDNPLRVVFSHIRNPAFVERFGVDVCPGYGLTETMGVGALTPAAFSAHPPGSIGLPSPSDAEIKAISEDGSRLPPRKRGELCVRHPHVFLGYYKDPENSAKTLRDGWVHTGDLGSIDENGLVYFHGRIKNVIKRAGENIAGEELEFILGEHPAIDECVVCGVPDPIWTEEVYATVAVGPGLTVTEADLVEWCAGRVSDWKIPRYIRLLSDPLPKLANGKTDRLAVNAAAEPDSAWDRQVRQPAK